jgi:hypothetical protein
MSIILTDITGIVHIPPAGMPVGPAAAAAPGRVPAAGGWGSPARWIALPVGSPGTGSSGRCGMVSPVWLDQVLGAWLRTRAARDRGGLVAAVDGKAVLAGRFIAQCLDAARRI